MSKPAITRTEGSGGAVYLKLRMPKPKAHHHFTTHVQAVFIPQAEDEVLPLVEEFLRQLKQARRVQEARHD